MSMRRCPVCRGIAILGEDGLQCYSCGRTIHDPQKRLPTWCSRETDKEEGEDKQARSIGTAEWIDGTRRRSG